jgi:hypothetical protein
MSRSVELLEDELRRFDHIVEVMEQLLDHVAAVSSWVFDYTERNEIPIDDKLSFHLKRIDMLLSEVTNPPDTRLMDRILKQPKRDVTGSYQNLIPDTPINRSVRLMQMQIVREGRQLF